MVTTLDASPGTEREKRQGGSYNQMDEGDLLANNTGGGGGWGDPLEREPAMVARDIRNGFVSAKAARRDHGVVADPDSGTIDEEATRSLRPG